MENKKLDTVVDVKVEESTEEKKGFLTKAKEVLKPSDKVKKVVKGLAIFGAGAGLGAFAASKLLNRNSDEEEYEDNDEVEEDNIDEN